MNNSGRAKGRPPKPTICQVLHTLSVGGAEVLAREFAIQAAPSFRTVFACLDEVGEIGNQLLTKGFTVECLGRKPGLDRQLMGRLAKFCREQRVDVIHAHQYAPFVYAALSRWQSVGSIIGGRPPILMTEHGRHYPDVRKIKRVFANKFLFRQHDRCVAVGQGVKQALIDKEGIRTSRIEVVYNGIDVTRFQRCQSTRAATREELGLAKNDIAVFQVARINPLKDHETAIRTFSHLKDMLNIKLFVIGDGELKPAVATLVHQLHLDGSVKMLGTRHDVDRLINAADISLLTSISEGIPLTLIEAMANGLPCVASNVGGVPEVVIDGTTGFLVAAKDDKSFAERVRLLATDADLRSKFGKAATARTREKFSDVEMHSSYQDLYRQMSVAIRPVRRVS
ncbi:MAG: glycosyltransferase [Pirellulaceae bacterium]